VSGSVKVGHYSVTVTKETNCLLLDSNLADIQS